MIYRKYKITSLILFIFLLTACSANSSNQVQLKDASSDIQAIYKNRCISCHGIDLSGKVGEQTNLQTVNERLTYEEIEARIQNGGEIMPAFANDLSEDEIKQLASWLSKQ